MSFPAPLPEQPPMSRVVLALALLAQALHDMADQPVPPATPVPQWRSGYLTPREMAAQTGNSSRAISEWCQRGVIAAERHGRRWRIPEAEVQAKRKKGEEPGA